MSRSVTFMTINGQQTVHGMTVGELRQQLAEASPDLVVCFMFEVTPTVRKELSQVEAMIMPAHSAHAGDDVLLVVGPEIENAKYEGGKK